VTDIETLRAALQEPPPETFAQPDLAAIMETGTRLRRRRRLAAGGGVAAVAVAVVAVVFGATQLRAPAPNVAAPPGPTLSTASSTPPTTYVPAPPSEPAGAIVDTGIVDAQGEFVIYGFGSDDPAVPKTRFGMELAHRDAAGKLIPALALSEYNGADRAGGFHQVTGGDSVRGGVFLPVVGYFAGPVAKITSTVHGRIVQAGTAKWSKDDQVTFFWFTPQDVPDHNLMTPPIAYDAAGNRLTK
jgi:hypothetical protein